MSKFEINLVPYMECVSCGGKIILTTPIFLPNNKDLLCEECLKEKWEIEGED